MSTDNPTVTIVIPTWNRRQDLLECLQSLSKVSYSPVEIVVVDNASEDNSATAVKATFPKVKIIQLDRNVGAPASSNVGFNYAIKNLSDYVLRLDSDTIVSPNFLDFLITTGEAMPDVGIISPKILYFDQPNVIWYAGADAHPWHFGAINEYKNKKDEKVKDIPRLVDYAWGACMLIKRDVIEKTKGFDEDFFIYYEEVDFCKRVKELGYKLFYQPQAVIWHKVGESKTNSFTAYNWNRSKTILYRKHAKNGLHRISLMVFLFLYAVISPLFKNRMGGNRGPIIDTFRGILAGLAEDVTK